MIEKSISIRNGNKTSIAGTSLEFTSPADALDVLGETAVMRLINSKTDFTIKCFIRQFKRQPTHEEIRLAIIANP